MFQRSAFLSYTCLRLYSILQNHVHEMPGIWVCRSSIWLICQSISCFRHTPCFFVWIRVAFQVSFLGIYLRFHQKCWTALLTLWLHVRLWRTFAFFSLSLHPPGHPVLPLYQRVVTVNVSSKIGVMTHQYEERGPAGCILCVQPDSSKELNSPTTSLFSLCVKLKSCTRITALSFLFSFIQWVICDVLSDILIRPLIFTEILSHTPNPWARGVSQSTAPSFLWVYPSVTAVVTKDHKLGSLKSQKFIAS